MPPALPAVVVFFARLAFAGWITLGTSAVRSWMFSPNQVADRLHASGQGGSGPPQTSSTPVSTRRHEAGHRDGGAQRPAATGYPAKGLRTDAPPASRRSRVGKPRITSATGF